TTTGAEGLGAALSVAPVDVGAGIGAGAAVEQAAAPSRAAETRSRCREQRGIAGQCNKGFCPARCTRVRFMPRGHVLVLDDEPTILTTLQKALTLEGYAVDVAGGVAIAEEKLAKRSYDIALFDVSLPDGDGVSLLQRLRTSGNDLPVVMMSGHATIDAAVRATRLGASDFLEKPLSTDRLLLVLDNILRLVR